MDLNRILTEPLFIFIAVLVLLAFAVRLAISLHYFGMELRYLNNEIARSEGAERRHYIRKKRRLWLSLIPFVKYY